MLEVKRRGDGRVITKKHIDALVASKIDLFMSNELFKNNISDMQREVRMEIESLVDLAAPEVCLNRNNFFNVKGATSDDYRERILELNENNFLLAGIRFYGLDVTKPFVSVQASFTELNEDIISKISDLVRKDFSMFKPLSIHLTLPEDFKISVASMQIDRYTVVGVIDDLIQRELISIPDSIELVALTDMEFYDDYLKEYELFHERVPILRSVVKTQSIDDFKEAIQEKLLYKIIINGSVAGLIAGLARDYYGLKGVNILEEILFDSFQGKGFGVYIQRAFTLKLKNRYSILWGTISDLNTPSLKTALKNGRHVMEIESAIFI